MKKKMILILSCILLLELFGGYMYVMYLHKQTIKMVSVPVSTKKILPRNKISINDIEYIEVNSAYINDDIYIDSNDIIGKYTDIYTSIPKGSLFYKEALYNLNELPDNPHLLLNENQVSFSLVTDLNKLSGNTLVSGNHVDVYVSIARRNDKPLFDKLVSNVRILAIKDRKGLDIDDPKGTGIPYICVLAIDKEAINLLSNAVKVGDVELYVTGESYNNHKESLVNYESLVLEYLK